MCIFSTSRCTEIRTPLSYLFSFAGNSCMFNLWRVKSSSEIFSNMSQSNQTQCLVHSLDLCCRLKQHWRRRLCHRSSSSESPSRTHGPRSLNLMVKEVSLSDEHAPLLSWFWRNNSANCPTCTRGSVNTTTESCRSTRRDVSGGLSNVCHTLNRSDMCVLHSRKSVIADF